MIYKREAAYWVTKDSFISEVNESCNKTFNIDILSSIRLIPKITLLIVISLAFFGLVLMVQPAFAVDYLNYSSQELGISFAYPANWTVNETTLSPELTVTGPSFQDGIFIINLGKGPPNFILQDPKSKNSVLYFNYKTLESKTDYLGGIIDGPYSLLMGGYIGESMVYKIDLGGGDNINQEWYVVLPNDRSFLISYDVPAVKFDVPESKNIRATFLRTLQFFSPN